MQKKSTIKQNILQFIEYKNITRYEFYKKTGITRGILDQNNGMSEENTAKLLAYFPEINTEWLITGEGNMLKSELPVAKLTGGVMGIPLIPASAMAGAFTGDNQVLLHECDRYVVPVFKGADFLIAVKGNSMYPKYSSGDIVACKKLPIDTFFQWNKIYVLDTCQGPLIKRVKKGRTDDTILIVSDNDKYDPFELHKNQVYNIAIVMGAIRLE